MSHVAHRTAKILTVLSTISFARAMFRFTNQADAGAIYLQSISLAVIALAFFFVLGREKNT